MTPSRPGPNPAGRDSSADEHDMARLGRARFILLTTYRASGEPVATPVWVVRHADQLAILTNADSGKVRRLRRSPALALVPCSPRGEPHLTASPVRGRADILTDEDAVGRVWTTIRRKYVVEHLVLRVLGWLRPATRRWHGPQVVLRITLEGRSG